MNKKPEQSTNTDKLREEWEEQVREKIREFNRIFGGYIETSSSMGVSSGNKAKLWLQKTFNEIREKALAQQKDEVRREVLKKINSCELIGQKVTAWFLSCGVARKAL